MNEEQAQEIRNQIIDLVGESLTAEIDISDHTHVPDNQIEKLLLITQDLRKELGRDVSDTDLFIKLIELSTKHKRIRTSGTEKTFRKIDDKVQEQKELNTTAQETITTKTGITIKYKQRAFTLRWIMENVRPAPHSIAVRAYLDKNKDEINDHHIWLLQDNNMSTGTEEDIKKGVRGFNKRTASAESRVNKGEFSD